MSSEDAKHDTYRPSHSRGGGGGGGGLLVGWLVCNVPAKRI